MRADYSDHIDAVSGEPVALLPVTITDPHFADRRTDDYFQRQVESAIAAEERFERHRSVKLKAAIDTLQALIAEADMGDGLAASRVIEAAMSDLIIGTLCDRLREAKKLIPGHAQNTEARLRIDAALAAAGRA